MAITIEPFRIAVPDDELEFLRTSIARTRWPDQIAGSGWTYGTDRDYLQQLMSYWADGFDWRRVEAELNARPQFRADIDGTGVHFVHHRGVGPDPLPLVLTHGWPSTFFEFHKVIAPLADPVAHGGDPADAFHVVVPSLPGYGFSDIPSEPGMTPRRSAALWAALMGELGYESFGAHGCDWGAYVTALLGLDFPERLTGIHMGMVNLRAADDPTRARTYQPTAEELERRARRRTWMASEIGYSTIQGSKPQTLGYGLTDSPAGLAAWIVEKFRRWAECNGDVESVFPRDELLTNIAIYWFTRTINSADRLYFESRNAPVALAPGQRVTTPAGFLLERAMEGNIGPPPRASADAIYDIRRWTIAERGGHFPAWETPDLFVDEVRAFFRDLRTGAHREHPPSRRASASR
jgi:pimeloyl-ACP methyl ester carboxylesterase